MGRRDVCESPSLIVFWLHLHKLLLFFSLCQLKRCWQTNSTLDFFRARTQLYSRMFSTFIAKLISSNENIYLKCHLQRVYYAFFIYSNTFFGLLLAHASVYCASISCGFRFDRVLISEALFTFPVKRFMQELVHSMISSRFHAKDRSVFFSKEL